MQEILYPRIVREARAEILPSNECWLDNERYVPQTAHCLEIQSHRLSWQRLEAVGEFAEDLYTVVCSSGTQSVSRVTAIDAM